MFQWNLKGKYSFFLNIKAINSVHNTSASIFFFPPISWYYHFKKGTFKSYSIFGNKNKIVFKTQNHNLCIMNPISGLLARRINFYFQEFDSEWTGKVKINQLFYNKIVVRTYRFFIVTITFTYCTLNVPQLKFQ